MMTVLLEPFAALSTNNFALGYSGLKISTVNEERKGKDTNNYDDNFGRSEIKGIVDFDEVFHFIVLVVRSIQGKAIHVFW